MSSALDIFTAVYLNIPSVRAANYTLCFMFGTWFLSMIDCFDTLGLSILIVCIILLVGIDETIVWTVKAIRHHKTLEQLHREYLEGNSDEETEEDDDESGEESGEESGDESAETQAEETANKNEEKNKAVSSSEDSDEDNNTLRIPNCCKRYVSIGVKTTDDLIAEEDLESIKLTDEVNPKED
jgi:hypothetical protein